MTIKDFVVPLTGAAGDESAVVAAIALVTSQNAHLALLELVNPRLSPLGPFGSGELDVGDVYGGARRT